MKTCFLFLFFHLFSHSFSQTTFKLNLSVAQTYQDDWRLGKKLALDVANILDFNSKFNIDTLSVNFTARTSFGFLFEDSDQRQNPIGVPTLNEIFLESTLKLPIGWAVDPYFTSTNSTQLVRAYRYVNDVRIPSAGYRDPAITLQTIGMMHNYKINPNDYTSTKLGLSLRQVRADEFRQQTDDFTTIGIIENYKAESGLTINNESFFKLDSSSTFKTRLDLFGTFKKPDKWIMKWQNELSIILVKVITLIIKFDFIYDEAQAMRLQYLQNTRFGVSATL